MDAIVSNRTIALSLLFEGPIAGGATAAIAIDEDIDLRFSMDGDSPRTTGIAVTSPIFAPFPLAGFSVDSKTLLLRFAPTEEAIALKVSLQLEGPAVALTGTATLPEGLAVSAELPGGSAAWQGGRISLPL